MTLHDLLDQVLHLIGKPKDTLVEWSGHTWFAWALFAVLFAETGLVVTPFLPGDSLLFAIGAIAAAGGARLPLPETIVLMCSAVLLGDLVNYSAGRLVGPRVFRSETSRLLNRKHLLKSQSFYEKYGAKTIVIARFVPIVRTFAPFVAGIGRMKFARFLAFSVSGGIGWVVSMTAAGYVFGQIPWVDKHFDAVVIMIVAISLTPMVVEYLRARRAARG
jgi:membrane-associated protein